MTKKELRVVRKILLLITNTNSFVAEALAYVDKDLARRDQQSKEQKNVRGMPLEIP